MPPQLWKIKVWYIDKITKRLRIRIYKNLCSPDECITLAGNELGMGWINKMILEWYWAR